MVDWLPDEDIVPGFAQAAFLEEAKEEPHPQDKGDLMGMPVQVPKGEAELPTGSDLVEPL